MPPPTIAPFIPPNPSMPSSIPNAIFALFYCHIPTIVTFISIIPRERKRNYCCDEENLNLMAFVLLQLIQFIDLLLTYWDGMVMTIMDRIILEMEKGAIDRTRNWQPIKCVLEFLTYQILQSDSNSKVSFWIVQSDMYL